MSEDFNRRLATLLTIIGERDLAGAYAQRNQAIYSALPVALTLGYAAGIRFDPAEPEWPVAFIDLPTGQVSWHLEQFPHPWDGHTTDQKWERVHAYMRAFGRERVGAPQEETS